MYSYGYKIPELQNQDIRQRQPSTPRGVVLDASVDDVVDSSPSVQPQSEPAPAPPVSLSPREFFESQILPQVREVLGASGVQDAYTLSRTALARESQARLDAQREREFLEDLRGTPVDRPVRLPEPISMKGLGSFGEQPGIPGLLDQVEETNEGIEQLRKQRIVEAFGDLLTEYPELSRVLYTDPDQRGKASRVRKAGFAPYLNYVDKEQVFSAPEDRVDLYNQILSAYDNLDDHSVSRDELTGWLREIEDGYTSGDPERQAEARDLLKQYFPDPEKLDRIETPSFRENRPVIGGGGYEPVKDNPLINRINQRARSFNDLYRQLGATDIDEAARTYPGLQSVRDRSGAEAGFYLDPDTKEVFDAEFDDPEAYGVAVRRYVPGGAALAELDAQDILGSEISKNALRFLADYPVVATSDISFSTREPGYGEAGYSAKVLPPELVNPVTSFVADTAFRDLRPGTVLTNNPLSTSDLLDKRIEEGKSAKESSTIRKLQPFIDANSQLPNLRGLAYTSAGFGPVTKSGSQVSYIDEQGQAIPIQLERPEVPLRGIVAIREGGNASVFNPSLPASATARYYGLDPVSSAASAIPGVLSNIRRVPSALLPGAADLIPSPEAIRTGYAQGPVEMGKQMAQEFAQSLPTAAGAAMLLSTPALAPLAPGIGAGMVGTAGAKALNEVVRQETGEGIVPKVRQFLGTAPRTGVSAPQVQGEKPLTAEIRPLTQAQRQKMNQQATQSEMQRRMELAKERFNPRKGEFGLSELIFGR